ncbi:hypothetical protein ZWY2020_041914 [Hordeum vulgare]|nr:hypothetical protein ZWY2020_041914 [Hordeum vulgare]
MAITLGVRRLMVYGDSDLVVNQVMKEWDVRNSTMTAYYNVVRKLKKKLEGLELHHVPRLKNQAADELAKHGSTRRPVPSDFCLEHLHLPSVKEDPFAEELVQPKSSTDPTEVEVPAVVDLIMEILALIPEWTVPFIAYILRQELPEDEVQAKRSSLDRSPSPSLMAVMRGKCFRRPSAVHLP